MRGRDGGPVAIACVDPRQVDRERRELFTLDDRQQSAIAIATRRSDVDPRSRSARGRSGRSNPSHRQAPERDRRSTSRCQGRWRSRFPESSGAPDSTTRVAIATTTAAACVSSRCRSPTSVRPQRNRSVVGRSAVGRRQHDETHAAVDREDAAAIVEATQVSIVVRSKRCLRSAALP